MIKHFALKEKFETFLKPENYENYDDLKYIFRKKKMANFLEMENYYHIMNIQLILKRNFVFLVILILIMEPKKKFIQIIKLF